jgi:hypothetical protein
VTNRLCDFSASEREQKNRLEMSEFAEDLRYRCRNPRCRMKLPMPVANQHRAFCKPGCHSSFYLRRCIVCESEKPAGSTARRIVCRRPKCESKYRQNRGHYSFSATDTISAANASRSAQKSHVPDGQKLDRWRIVAGPPLTPNQLHCATVPDGSDCQWKGGEYERLEAKKRAALKAAEQAEIEANGEFTEPEWRQVISPDGIRCFVTRFRDGGAPLSPLPGDDTVKRSDGKPCAPSVPIADDLSIPDFLKREPTAVSESPDGILEAAE